MLTRRRIKCCLIGDFGVGKTSIVNAFLDKPVLRPQSTMGIDFISKSLTIGHEDVYLSIWDTAGSERFRSLLHSYLRDAELIIVVYDTTRKHSNIVYWMRIVEQHSAKIIGVVGNKTDLTCDLVDNMKDLLMPWSRQSTHIIHETLSTRNTDEVKRFFKRCLQKLVEDTVSEFKIPYVKIQPNKPKTHKCCT